MSADLKPSGRVSPGLVLASSVTTAVGLSLVVIGQRRVAVTGTLAGLDLVLGGAALGTAGIASSGALLGFALLRGSGRRSAALGVASGLSLALFVRFLHTSPPVPEGAP